MGRYVTALAICPAAILFPMAVVFLGESPHYLAAQGRHIEATEVVKYIAAMNGKSSVLYYLDASRNQNEASNSNRASIPCLGNLHSAEQAVESTHVAPFIDRARVILGSKFGSISLGGIYLCFLSNFLFYGLTYALPQIFKYLKDDISPAVQLIAGSMSDFPGIVLAHIL